MHMGLHPNFLSHILQPFSADSLNNNITNDWNDLPSLTDLNPHQYPPVTPNLSQHHLDTDSKSLEHHLNSALAILLQTTGILADGITPQARNTLKAINVLVSIETPTHNPLPFKSVKEVVKWLRSRK